MGATKTDTDNSSLNEEDGVSVPGMMEARVAGRKWVSGPSFLCRLSFFPPSRDPSLPPSLLPSAVLDVSFERWTFVSSLLPDACPRMSRFTCPITLWPRRTCRCDFRLLPLPQRHTSRDGHVKTHPQNAFQLTSVRPHGREQRGLSLSLFSGPPVSSLNTQPCQEYF